MKENPVSGPCVDQKMPKCWSRMWTKGLGARAWRYPGMLASLLAVVALAAVCTGAMLPVEDSMEKKPNNLLSLRVWTCCEIPRTEVMKMVMIPLSVRAYSPSDCQSKSRQNQPLHCFSEHRTVTEESSSQTDALPALGYRLTVLRPLAAR